MKGMIIAIALLAASGRGQDDMRARITDGPRLMRHAVLLRQKVSETRQPGVPYELSFKMNVATSVPRAWPLQVHAALCVEDRDGARKWKKALEISGLRKESEQDVNADLVTGAQSIKAIFDNVDGKVIAWRLRVQGRMLLDPDKPDGYIATVSLIRRDWSADGIESLRDEPFQRMDEDSDIITQRAAQIRAAAAM